MHTVIYSLLVLTEIFWRFSRNSCKGLLYPLSNTSQSGDFKHEVTFT